MGVIAVVFVLARSWLLRGEIPRQPREELDREAAGTEYDSTAIDMTVTSVTVKLRRLE